MGEWGWVILAYGVFYGSLLLYAGSVVVRTRRTRERLRESG